MGFNSSLLQGMAQMLADNEFGEYSETGTYAEPDTGIFIGTDNGRLTHTITIGSYPVEDTDLTAVIVGMQFRIKGGRDPLGIEDVSDKLYDLLHNKQHYKLNGIHVNLSWRQSGTWIGQDSDQNMERVENFYLRAERLAPNKLP